MSTYIFIDCETTGTDPQRHSMIQFGLAVMKDGVHLAKEDFEVTFQPGESGYISERKISLGAMQVNGASALRSAGRDPEVMAEKDAVVAIIDRLLGLRQVYGRLTFAGQNIAFDMGFLKALLAAHDFENLDAIANYSTLDTAAIGTYLMDVGALTGLQRASLHELQAALSANRPGKGTAHTALHDAVAALYVYQAMLNLVKEKAGDNH